MLMKRSPLPPLLLGLTQRHRSAQKEALKGKYHEAGMPYFPDEEFLCVDVASHQQGEAVPLFFRQGAEGLQDDHIGLIPVQGCCGVAMTQVDQPGRVKKESSPRAASTVSSRVASKPQGMSLVAPFTTTLRSGLAKSTWTVSIISVVVAGTEMALNIAG
ncbi:hypothetical protein EYF80_012361 [Liparis tanakae]|uniref:Uncharacterized protein n=1 Tax=Liparis tanakae TaxID=230148 RepID=A0A4Z2IHZ8_9TELE|nr:hypothetical protein EYF80_012361 [Liparis tanakae]